MWRMRQHRAGGTRKHSVEDGSRGWVLEIVVIQSTSLRPSTMKTPPCATRLRQRKYVPRPLQRRSKVPGRTKQRGIQRRPLDDRRRDIPVPVSPYAPQTPMFQTKEP
ncbi:hypothetical protein EVAR_14619_1 [Eumeta japonica]|uniref:Uncharacterized protein n=1 Tax=Eumeta variegata TaxID=151549 RepID=A0A4C1U283_EUMVA|nr:hypothetical protein EVAR_14619_1 [Eumeta japonica]